MVIKLKAALWRTIRVSFNKALLYRINLDSSFPREIGTLAQDFQILELDRNNLNLYLDCDLIQRQRSKIQTRFEHESYRAYIVVKEGKIVYMTWLLIGGYELHGGHYRIKKENIGFLLDSICHKDYRGQGIHSFMNSYRLNKLSAIGVKIADVLILSSNIYAIKSQVKIGFRLYKQIWILRLGSKYLYSRLK